MSAAPAPALSESADDAALARRVAEEAGRLLLGIQRSGLFEGKPLGRVGDRTANAFIMEALRTHRPDDAILSEEERDDRSRLSANRVWIVDPLDGTREFSEGRADWAVHVALAVDGIATTGAVALPAEPLTLCTGRASPVPPPGSRLRVLVSRSRPGREALEVAAALDAELIPMGSAGAKAMAVVRGLADIYLHSGGQYEWDNCAPVAVAVAHGLHCSRIDGTPLTYNHADPSLPDLLICPPALAPRVLELVAALPPAP